MLRVTPPVDPMLCKSVETLPEGPDLRYEPKWDGFRCILFKDGDDITLGSRNTKPLTRYFPDVEAAARDQLPDTCVFDGELVMPTPDGLGFPLLGNRIHPAASRVKMLAEETPAHYVAFDCLDDGTADLRGLGFEERRGRLEALCNGVESPFHLSPMSTDPARAHDWFDRFEGAGLDGVIVKRADLTYQSGKRVMHKVKHHRTADCVVAGFRWHKSGPIVGSVMLGLYDDEGDLHHVGVIGAFSMKTRQELVDTLEPYTHGVDGHPWTKWAEFMVASGQKVPQGNRWAGKKDMSFVPVRPELVVEVHYDQLEGSRFRHAGQFKAWRPDRSPQSCRYDQLDVVVPAELADIFDG